MSSSNVGFKPHLHITHLEFGNGLHDQLSLWINGIEERPPDLRSIAATLTHLTISVRDNYDDDDEDPGLWTEFFVGETNLEYICIFLEWGICEQIWHSP